MREQEDRTGPEDGGRVLVKVDWGRGKMGKGCGRVNIVEILYVNMYANGKMIPVETISGMGGGEVKEKGRRAELKYDKFDIL
jgi:hypothetical protein